MCKDMSSSTGACASKCTHKTLKSLGLLGLRLAVGIIFIYTGYMKLGPNNAGATAMMAKVIGPESWGAFWAYLVGILELVGGLMVILGVYARYAAVWLGTIMVVAMFTAHPDGAKFNTYFTELALLGASLALVGVGAGKWRLVKTECHCRACCSTGEVKEMKGSCCGGNCGGGSEPEMMEEKKESMVK